MPSRYQLKLFKPKFGRMSIPTCMVTLNPFDSCPCCGSGRSEITKDSILFECGLKQTITDGDEFAVSSTCPYAMMAVKDLKTRRISRGESLPATLLSYAPDSFSIGDPVRWVSQSAGRETIKSGVIVSIVPPEARPEAYIPDGMRRNSTTGYGKARPHTTYLVRVKGKGNMAYWPRVHCLERF